MKFLARMLPYADKIFPPRKAYAHCDIPCGIYTPHPAQVAAQTVEKMVQKLLELTAPQDIKEQGAILSYLNSVSRMVAVKEQHAELAKKELLILWTDYFKEEHLAMFPDLHTTFWKAAKLCSKNKQEVNLEAAGQLRKAVDEIAQMFQKAEEAKKR